MGTHVRSFIYTIMSDKLCRVKQYTVKPITAVYRGTNHDAGESDEEAILNLVWLTSNQDVLWWGIPVTDDELCICCRRLHRVWTVFFMMSLISGFSKPCMQMSVCN